MMEWHRSPGGVWLGHEGAIPFNLGRPVAVTGCIHPASSAVVWLLHFQGQLAWVYVVSCLGTMIGSIGGHGARTEDSQYIEPR